MKKEFTTPRAKEYSEKSDTELVDIISDNGSDIVQGTTRAILDLRLKKAIQFLTEVIEKNNEEMKTYNRKLNKLTFWILFFTVVMAILAIINIFILFKK